MAPRLLLLVFAIQFAGTAAGATSDRLPFDAIRLAPEAAATWRLSPAVANAAAALDADLRKVDSSDSAAMLISSLCHAPHAVAASAALSRWLDRIAATQTLSDAGKEALQALAQCPERVYSRHPETAGDWWVPAYANAARASALLARDRRDQAVLAVAKSLSDKRMGDRYHESDATIVRDAVLALDPSRRKALAAGPGPIPPTLLLALATTGAVELIEPALSAAPSSDLVAQLPALFAALPAERRLPALRHTLARPELASSTILLTRDWPDDPQLDAWWLARLAEIDNGASAAQVVAARWSPARLAAGLAAAESSTLQLHLALALRLNDSVEARDLQYKAAVAGELPPAVTAEVLR